MDKGKRVYFISDMHLGASTLESPRETEKRVVRWLDSVKDTASAIYMLGDVLDYWYEYRSVVPRGYVRFFGKIAELTDSGVEVHWLIGNHDIWIFDYLPSSSMVGKPVGVDIMEQKMTLPLLGAISNAADGRAAEIRSKVMDIGAHPEYRDEIIAFVRSEGGIEYAASRLQEYLAEARAALGLLPGTEERDFLSELACYVGERLS